jgi:hypothetical protein
MWQSPQVTRTPNLLSNCGDCLEVLEDLVIEGQVVPQKLSVLV